MARKTFEVETLKNQINHMLATSENGPNFRSGLALLLENVLHETGNYKGFRYLLEGQCPGLPGVNYLDGVPHPDYKKRFENTDDTRVEFH